MPKKNDYPYTSGNKHILWQNQSMKVNRYVQEQYLLSHGQKLSVNPHKNIATSIWNTAFTINLQALKDGIFRDPSKLLQFWNNSLNNKVWKSMCSYKHFPGYISLNAVTFIISVK